MKYNIFFVKTAKTGTETIKHYLTQYANDNHLIINDHPFLGYYRQKNFNVNTNHVLVTPEAFTHFQNSIDKNLPILRVSSIRKPIERLYSHYCFGHPYYTKGMDFNEWYIKTMKGEIEDKWHVPQWGDRTNEYMSNYLNIKSVDEIKNKYDFFFIKEKFNESLDKFESVLKYKFYRTKPLNVGKSKKDYIFDNLTIELFNKHNTLDNALYDHVLKNYL